ncbi:wax ester/triacylglycerol synthase domain-containing protein [Rhodococcus jostii]|uniref:wax ester/triacylglycerol synthase domain-containing protein n=1 Tax=Rhodococcus jostii TaxID=132919 RepID=UPI00364F1B45
MSPTEAAELFRKRPVHRLHGYPWWRLEKHVDLGYHVRHTAVPGDGTMTELLSLVSQMHSMPLDPQHPMSETRTSGTPPRRGARRWRPRPAGPARSPPDPGP